MIPERTVTSIAGKQVTITIYRNEAQIDGLTTAWSYDANSRLTQARNATASTISQYDYTYDTAGRRVSRAKSGAAMSESRTDTYGYNARSELISAAKTGGSPSPATEHEYADDPIGNRTSSSDLGTTRAYTANSLNQYTGISDGVDTFAPQFDDDGDQTLIQTKTGIWSVTYNGENRPVSWSCGETNIVMSFDCMGRRVQYTETVGVTTNAHRTFVYDNYLQIANSELATSNSQLFVWDPTEPVATRPLVWHHNGGVYFYTHDGNKNISELVDGNGAVVAHYEYDPFGDVTVAAGDLASDNTFRFSSEYADDTLGVVYYNYRHYDPVTGRWLGRDRVEYVSSYNYVRNGCYCYIDWLGCVWIQVAMQGYPHPNASNCLGGAMTGKNNQYRYPFDEYGTENVNFIEAMKAFDWDCFEVKEKDECKPKECHDRILITNYLNERNPNKNPWTDPSFIWSLLPGMRSDLHAIRYDDSLGCYKQIPRASTSPQEFDTNIDWSLFKDKPLLCCHKKKG